MVMYDTATLICMFYVLMYYAVGRLLIPVVLATHHPSPTSKRVLCSVLDNMSKSALYVRG